VNRVNQFFFFEKFIGAKLPSATLNDNLGIDFSNRGKNLQLDDKKENIKIGCKTFFSNKNTLKMKFILVARQQFSQAKYF
jgi:hypothetical protein